MLLTFDFDYLDYVNIVDLNLGPLNVMDLIDQDGEFISSIGGQG